MPGTQTWAAGVADEIGMFMNQFRVSLRMTTAGAALHCRGDNVVLLISEIVAIFDEVDMFLDVVVGAESHTSRRSPQKNVDRLTVSPVGCGSTRRVR